MQGRKVAGAHERAPRLWRRVQCGLHGTHEAVHHPLGGFRCARCGKCGGDLDELGFAGEGYVSESERRRLVREGSGRAA
jgi:hypothetical protein